MPAAAHLELVHAEEVRRKSLRVTEGPISVSERCHTLIRLSCATQPLVVPCTAWQATSASARRFGSQTSSSRLKLLAVSFWPPEEDPMMSTLAQRPVWVAELGKGGAVLRR